MSDQVERRKLDPEIERLHERMTIFEAALEGIRARVYNGLAKELRTEVHAELNTMRGELSGVRNLVVSVLVALVLSLAGLVIEGRVSSTQSSKDMQQVTNALTKIGTELDMHIGGNAP